MRLFCVLVLLATVSVAPDARGQKGSGASTKAQREDGRTLQYFEKLWEERRKLLAAGKPDPASKALGLILQGQSVSGWPNLTAYGAALGRESAAAAASGRLDDAVRLARAGTVLAPHSRPPWLHLARSHFRLGEYGEASQAAFQATWLTWSEPPHLRFLMGNLGLALLGGLLIACLGLALANIYRHFRLALHDLSHALPANPRTWQVGLFALAVLAAPVLFRLGAVWVVLIWLVLLAPYYKRRDRLAAAGSLAVLAALPALLPGAIGYWAYPGSHAHDLYRAARSVDATAAAERIAAREELSSDAHHVLGMRAYWAGDLDEAIHWLSKGAADDDASADVLVSLGNAKFLRGDPQGAKDAVAAYEQAIAKQPHHVEALFNMSRVLSSMTLISQAGEAHRKAQSYDLGRVELYDRQAKMANRAFVVEAPMRVGEFSAQAVDAAGAKRAVDLAWGWLATGPSRAFFSVVALLALLLVMTAVRLRRPIRLSTECRHCLSSSCVRCFPDLPDQQYCGECYHAVVLADDMSRQLRILKEIEAHRQQAQRHKVGQVAAVVLAGSSQLLKGATLRGMTFMALTCAGILGVLGSTSVLPIPSLFVVGDSSLMSLTVAAIVALLGYFGSLWDSVQER